MSQRHHARRRRTYGRRLHDLHQRRGALIGPAGGEDGGAWPDGAWVGSPERMEPGQEPGETVSAAFADVLGPRLGWAGGRS